MFGGLQETLSRFEQRVDRRLEQVDARFLGIEGRLTALDHKLDQTRIGLEARVGAVDVKVGDLHRKSDARFKWLVGLLVSCLIGILLARFRP